MGGAFKTRKQVSAGGSGSTSNQKDAIESAAPHGTYAPVVENFDNNINIKELSERPAPKKSKVVVVKPPKGNELVVERVVCDEEGKGPDGGSVQIGNFTLEQLASTISEILMDEDWSKMEEAELNSILKIHMDEFIFT